MEKVHCWAGKAESWKKGDALSSQCVVVVHEGRVRISVQPGPSALGFCSSSPAVSYKHWTEADPFEWREVLCTHRSSWAVGVWWLLWKGLQVTCSLCHHSPQGAMPWTWSCVRAQLQPELKPCSESWVQARTHSKCTERLQRSYLLSHAMAVYFWCKWWATWEFRRAGCAYVKCPYDSCSYHYPLGKCQGAFL